MAAGNDGRSQTENVELGLQPRPQPDHRRLGPHRRHHLELLEPARHRLPDAAATSCRERLMDRFIVAPGELILLPDGQGGFVRRSGTSFAAPLVSGAIALLHDRWPWLANYPDESVDIILLSAARPRRARRRRGLWPRHARRRGVAVAARLQQSAVLRGARRRDDRAHGRPAARRRRAERPGRPKASTSTSTSRSETRSATSPCRCRRQLVGQVRTLTGAYENFQRFAQQAAHRLDPAEPASPTWRPSTCRPSPVCGSASPAGARRPI